MIVIRVIGFVKTAALSLAVIMFVRGPIGMMPGITGEVIPHQTIQTRKVNMRKKDDLRKKDNL
jgi:hypothetical protein